MLFMVKINKNYKKVINYQKKCGNNINKQNLIVNKY